ncbi:TlpA family protein disulfide reductase [Algoriphagus aquimarinus]|nr:thioredoxin-like domain-containing protein [Algoriphagus aquimarinus]
MKKHILTCFLGLLCLIGSELIAKSKVVDSPTEQEGASTSAHSQALIYGEISNPDSLGPLILTSSPFFVDAKSNFGKRINELETEGGNFFDGILNPRARKFSASVPLGDRAGYFSLAVGTRMLLDQFLVLPGDSLKINLDLAGFDISFGGPDAWFYEAQYAIRRERERVVFDAPRQLVLSSKSTIMTRDSNLQLMAEEEGKFGSELLVQTGRTSLERVVEELSYADRELASTLDLLNFYSPYLDVSQVDLLKLELYSQYYFGKLKTIRNFHYEKLDSYYTEAEKAAFLQRLDRALVQISDAGYTDNSRLVSAFFLEMTVEKIMLESLIKRVGFKAQVMENYQGELADRVLAGFLSSYLGQYPNPEAVIDDYLKLMEENIWRSRVLSLRNAHVPGEEIMDMEMINLDGERVTSSVFEGKPTVLYVYFSSCTHSSEYFQSFLYPMYDSLKAKGYRLMALSVDEDEALWRSQITRFSNPELTNLNISGAGRESFIHYYEIFAFPKTILLDGDGKIRSLHLDGKTAEEQKSMLFNTLDSMKGESEILKPLTETK